MRRTERMSEDGFELTKEEAMRFYFNMVLTRMAEDRHEVLYRELLVPVYAHRGTGQEAVGCGVSTLLQQDDYLIGTHRGAAEYIGKGLSVKDIYLEYGGRENAISGGRAGLHLHSPELNILPLLGGLGTDFSLAVGVAITIRNKGQDRVVVDYFGEGAAEQVDFHPAMNMAALFELPVIFCCCTNQYVELHHYRETTCTADIAARAAGYEMAWDIVQDGNDMFAVGRSMKAAITHAQEGKGPYFIEFKTYRVAGHHTADQGTYRDEKEVEEARKNDPIMNAQKALGRRQWATNDDFDRIGEESGRIIDEAVQALKDSGLPDGT